MSNRSDRGKQHKIVNIVKRTIKKSIGIVLAVSIAVLPFAADVWATVDDTASVTAEPVQDEVAAVTETISEVVTNQIPGWPQGPEVTSLTACLMDANTGAILYNKNMTEKMYPASTTKIMTALVALENSTLDEIVTFTETGVAEAYSGSSNLFTQVGEQFTMEDCLYALLLKSANDFASQIAEHVGGSVENFVQMMNAKAAELGCVNTHFNNAHGLPDENHYTCAYDLALIMQEVSKNETYCRISGTEIYTIPATPVTAKRTIENHNALIKTGHVRYYEGVIAGKTGYTDAARNTFVSVAEKNGLRLIEVTMSSPVSDESFINAHTLYDYGFSSFQNLTIRNANEVYSGGMVTVPLGVTDDQIVVKEGEAFDTTLGTMVNTIYYFNDYPVGEVSVTQETYQQEMTEMQAEQASEEEAMSEEENSELEKRQQELQEEQDAFDREMQGVFRIMILGLSICIFAGVLLIVVSVIRNKRKKLSIRKTRDKKQEK